MATIVWEGEKPVARSKRVVAAGEGVVVCDIRCQAAQPGWSPPEVAQGFVLVFVRAGSFRRRVNGRERFMDAVSAYFETPGGEQQIAHPGTAGDACTAIELSEDLAGVLADESPERISEPRQLRVREALERLADGQRSLTRLASDLGFADHAHLTRTVRRETGAVPSALRRLLTARELSGRHRMDARGSGY